MESFCGPCGHFRLVDSEARGVSGVQSSTAVTSEQGMVERVVMAVKRQPPWVVRSITKATHCCLGIMYSDLGLTVTSNIEQLAPA